MENSTLSTDETVAASDEELMQELVHENPDALTELYKRYRAVLKSVALQMVNDDADAEDVLQDVFIQVWDRADHYSASRGKLLGWLITLTKRRGIDRLRQRAAYRRATDRFETFCKTPEAAPLMERNAENSPERRDLRNLLGNLVDRLPEAQRQAVRFAFFRSMSQREIARATGAPLGTVKTRIELGIKKLGNMISCSPEKIL